MKEYNKEKLHEYAKELFALCLEKGMSFEKVGSVILRVKIGYFWYVTRISDISYLHRGEYEMPIWELIEKVKQL